MHSQLQGGWLPYKNRASALLLVVAVSFASSEEDRGKARLRQGAEHVEATPETALSLASRRHIIRGVGSSPEPTDLTT